MWKGARRNGIFSRLVYYWSCVSSHIDTHIHLHTVGCVWAVVWWASLAAVNTVVSGLYTIYTCLQRNTHTMTPNWARGHFTKCVLQSSWESFKAQTHRGNTPWISLQQDFRISLVGRGNLERQIFVSPPVSVPFLQFKVQSRPKTVGGTVWGIWTVQLLLCIVAEGSTCSITDDGWRQLAMLTTPQREMPEGVLWSLVYKNRRVLWWGCHAVPPYSVSQCTSLCEVARSGLSVNCCGSVLLHVDTRSCTFQVVVPGIFWTGRNRFDTTPRPLQVLFSYSVFSFGLFADLSFFICFLQQLYEVTVHGVWLTNSDPEL